VTSHQQRDVDPIPPMHAFASAHGEKGAERRTFSIAVRGETCVVRLSKAVNRNFVNALHGEMSGVRILNLERLTLELSGSLVTRSKNGA
jgi:hypothetical protein